MAKLVGAVLLLVVLIHCISDRTAYCRLFRSVGFTDREIIKCINSVADIQHCTANKCRRPRNHTAMKECLCCKGKRTAKTEKFCSFSCYGSRPL